MGEVGQGLVVPSLPRLGLIDVSVADQLRTVLVIGMIGFIESIVGAKMYAARHNYDVSPNRELVACKRFLLYLSLLCTQY